MILRSLQGDFHEYLTNAEVLQEILYVFGRRGQREEGVRLVRSIMNAVVEVIPIGNSEIEVAGRLLLQYPQLEARDAIHAAVVQIHSLEGIVSTDKVFDGIQGVRRFDPVEMATH